MKWAESAYFIAWQEKCVQTWEAEEYGKLFEKYLHALSYRQYFYLPIKSMECSIIIAMRVPLCQCGEEKFWDLCSISHFVIVWASIWLILRFFFMHVTDLNVLECQTYTKEHVPPFFSPPQSVKSKAGKHKVISKTSINVMPTSHQLFACFDTIMRLLHGKYVFLAVNRNDYTDEEKKNARNIKLRTREKKMGGNAWHWKSLALGLIALIYSKSSSIQHQANSFVFLIFSILSR